MKTMHLSSGLAPGMDRLVQLTQAQPQSLSCEEFYFLRHGQTACNALRIFQKFDEPLNAQGLLQATRAAQYLANEPIRSIVASDAVRASQTANTVAHHAALPWHPSNGLRERHFGALIGTSSVALDWACIPEGGETLEAFVQRTCAGLANALTRDAPVLVVAHGGTLLVLAAWLGVSLEAGTMGNAQPLHFTRHAHLWRATALMPTHPQADNLA